MMVSYYLHHVSITQRCNADKQAAIKVRALINLWRAELFREQCKLDAGSGLKRSEGIKVQPVAALQIPFQGGGEKRLPEAQESLN